MDTKTVREKLITLADWAGVKWVDDPACPGYPTGWFEDAGGKRSRVLCLDEMRSVDAAKRQSYLALSEVAPEEKKHGTT